jgi:hypothetical protein
MEYLKKVEIGIEFGVKFGVEIGFEKNLFNGTRFNLGGI